MACSLLLLLLLPLLTAASAAGAAYADAATFRDVSGPDGQFLSEFKATTARIPDTSQTEQTHYERVETTPTNLRGQVTCTPHALSRQAGAQLET